MAAAEERPKPDKYAVGARVTHPRSHAKPRLFEAGEGVVAEVIPMSKGKPVYRVTGADGSTLPVAFTEGELRAVREPKPPKPPAPEPAPEPRPVPPEGA
jgi:hypothetical protein